MRILIMNPTTSQAATKSVCAAGRQYARADTEVVAIEPEWGPESIESFFEGFLSAAAVFERLATYPEPFDALVMSGFGEPGREGARELLDVPVFDITESAAHLACMLGYRYGIVTTLDRSIPQIEGSLRTAGLLERCSVIRATNVPVLELKRDKDATRVRLMEEARKAVVEDDAEVICLGCGGMGGFDKELESELGVPVIDGVVAAVKFAEAAVDYGVSTSKARSFAHPLPKQIVGWPQTRARATT